MGNGAALDKCEVKVERFMLRSHFLLTGELSDSACVNGALNGAEMAEAYVFSTSAICDTGYSDSLGRRLNVTRGEFGLGWTVNVELLEMKSSH
jgi:hypothetical protein